MCDQLLGDDRHRLFDHGTHPITAELGLNRGDLLGRRGGANQDRLLTEPGLRPGERPADLVRASPESARIEVMDGPPGRTKMLDLSEGRRGATASEHRGVTVDPRQPIGRPRVTEQPGIAEIAGQPHRDPRAAGDQIEILRRMAKGDQMPVGDRISDRLTHAGRTQALDGVADRIGSLIDDIERQESDPALALPAEHPDQIAVGHGRQGMMAHRAVGQQLIPDEQMPLIDGPRVFREGGTGDGEIGAQRRHERFGHLTDIAGVGGIEGRAIFEQNLPRPLPAQPGERRQRRLDRLLHRHRARFEGHDQGLGVADIDRLGRQPDQLHGAHPVANEHAGEVGCAGEVVSDTSKQ